MLSKAAREVVLDVLVTKYKCRLGTVFQLLEKLRQGRYLAEE